MSGKCFCCNKRVGKLRDGKWVYYTKIFRYNNETKICNLINYCYVCEYFPVYWRCTECNNLIEDINVEYCIQQKNFTKVTVSRTCVACLHKIREEENKDLDCQCFICREINDMYTFIPK